MHRVKRGIVLSVSVLVAGFLFILAQPITTADAYQNSTQLQINYAEMIRMKLESEYQMRIIADGKPHFQPGALKISLETNSYYGYDFMLESDTTDLVNTANSEYRIPNMHTENYLLQNDDTIPMNTWGLGVVRETGNFKDIFYSNGRNIPLRNYTFMGRNTSDVAHDTLSLVIGARVDDTIPSGSYTASIKFTLVPRVIPYSIQETKYIQDVTSTVVSTMVADTPYQLTDLRDNKKYFIAKDSSNRVMMTQNLDYDLGEGDSLGRMTSNISNDYRRITNVGDHVSIDYNQAVYVSGNNVYRDNAGNETINNGVPETAEEANNKAGGYYSYAAAIANSSNLYDNGSIAVNTLCPSGWRLPNRLDAQLFNVNSPTNAWSSNNGYIGLDNTVKLDEGQLYWTAEMDKANKLVNVYNPSNGEIDNFVDARTLASIRCQYNNQNYTFRVNIVYDDNYTAVRNITSTTNPTYTFIVESTHSRTDEDRIIGFSASPEATIPEYPITSVLNSNSYTSCKANASTDNCYDFVTVQVPKSEITIYAIWSRKCNRDATTIQNAICMQDMNPSVKESMEEGVQYRLKDQRDGQKYWITKLSDGKVYMTQNLNYYSTQGRLQYPDESDVDQMTSVSSINASLEEGYYMKDGITKRSLSKQSDDPEEKHYNLGKYYKGGSLVGVCPGRWHVANIADAAMAAGVIADTAEVTNNTDIVGSGINYDASLTNERIFGAPLYLVAGGYRENEKSYYQGQKAKYLSSRDGNKIFAVSTDDGKNVITPIATIDSTQYGQVRCVSDPKSMADIEYMQDITNEIIMFTPAGFETQLKDKRDEKKYWVKKGANDYVYMLQNLDFDIPDTGITFTSNLTDMDSTISNNRDTRASFYIEAAHSIKADNNNPEIIYSYDAGEYYIDGDLNLVSTEELAEDAEELKEHVGNYYTATAASIGRFDKNLFQTFTICPKNWTVESQQYVKYYAYVNTSSPYYSTSNTSAVAHPDNPTYARKYAPVDGNGVFTLRNVNTAEGSAVWGNHNNHYFNGDVNNITNDRGFVLHPVRCVIDLPFFQQSYH